MIIGEIRRFLRDNNVIRVSRSMRDLAYKALAARETLSITTGGEPSVADIVAQLRRSGCEAEERDVVTALEAIIAPVSLYDPVYGDGSGDSIYVMDQISDPDGGDESWLEDIALSEAMSRLGERERTILNLRFFAGKTQMEIADEIGISQAQVSRLEKGAMEQIRRHM